LSDRKEKQPLTRETILEQAQLLFMSHGIQSTSLADIAGAAGISKGTLFYHFRSKDDLILEIASAHIQRLSDDILSYLKSSEGGPPDLRSLLKRFLEAVLAATLRNRLHLYLLEEGIRGNTILKSAMHDKYSEWLNTISSTLRHFLGAEATLAAPLILAMADGLVIQSMLGHAPPDIEAMIGILLPESC